MTVAASISIGCERPDLGSQRGVGQPRANALGDIEGGGPARHVSDAAVGQFHMNIFSHDFGPTVFEGAHLQVRRRWCLYCHHEPTQSARDLLFDTSSRIFECIGAKKPRAMTSPVAASPWAKL